MSGRCDGMNRERLPNRRAAETFEVEVNGLRYTATISRFADGRIGEIFVQNSKPGSASDCHMRDAGISASLALQYGCPLETLRRALLRDPRGAPSTPIGCVLDLLAGHSAGVQAEEQSNARTNRWSSPMQEPIDPYGKDQLSAIGFQASHDHPGKNHFLFMHKGEQIGQLITRSMFKVVDGQLRENKPD
jgi:hypothetical protein